jgi:CspA family cold shock protein
MDQNLPPAVNPMPYDNSDVVGKGGRNGQLEVPIMLKRGAKGEVRFFSFIKRFGFITVIDDDDANNEHHLNDGNNGNSEKKDNGKNDTSAVNEQINNNNDDVKQDDANEKGRNVDEGKEVFVHWTAVITQRGRLFCALHEGDKVEFDIVRGIKGPEAAAVTLIGGMKVRGTYFIQPSPIRYVEDGGKLMPPRFNGRGDKSDVRRQSRNKSFAEDEGENQKSNAEKPIMKKRNGGRRFPRRRYSNNAAITGEENAMKKTDDGGENNDQSQKQQKLQEKKPVAKKRNFGNRRNKKRDSIDVVKDDSKDNSESPIVTEDK